MNGLPRSSLSPMPGGEVFYPSSDGEPMAESQTHLMVMLWLIATLRQYYEAQRDVYVIGNMFLYYEEGNPRARKAPDVMVVKGVDYKETRDNFKAWEEGAVPCVIFEITSPSTADEDLQEKMELYQRLGVREYFLFDPRREYLPAPLMGYRLINQAYEPLPPSPDGAIPSAELGMILRPEEDQLALFLRKNNERLPTPPETHRLWKEALDELRRLRESMEEAERAGEQARRRAEQVSQQLREAEQRTELEQRRRQEAEQRAEQEQRQRQEAERRADIAQRQAEQARQQAEEERRRIEALTAEIQRLRAVRPTAADEAAGPSGA